MPVPVRPSALAIAVLVLAAGLAASLPGRPGGAAAVLGGAGQALDPAWDYCAAAVARVERQEAIPPHLLAAISTVESGRRHPRTGEISAWPWAVMAEGKGRYLPSRQAAIAEVEALRARGVRNIDVGCMQINLMYHPKAFSGLEEAFDPLANVAYAAAFLTRLRADQGSWTKAIGHYHSATPGRSNAYRTKVLAAWRDQRRNPPEPGATAVAGVLPVSVPAPPPQKEPASLLASLAFGRAGPVSPDPGS